MVLHSCWRKKTQFITSKGLVKTSKSCNLYTRGTNSKSLGTKEDEHRYMKSCNGGTFGNRDPKNIQKLIDRNRMANISS